MTTTQALLASWLVQGDDKSDEQYAARMAAPLPFDFAPSHPDSAPLRTEET